MAHPLYIIKDHFFETHLHVTRAWAAIFFVITLTLILLTRLFYLQAISYDHFKTLSQENRVKLIPAAPTRGLLYDRNGVILAENLPTYRLEITPEQVKDMDATLAELQQLIDVRESDIKRFRKLIEHKPRFEGIPLRFHLNEIEAARFAVNRYRYPGVDIEARLARHYPLRARTVHAVGYVGRIDVEEQGLLDPSQYSGTSHIGKLGVEKYYETMLYGKVGVEQVETNAEGRILRVLERKTPVPGRALYLTLDSRLQAVAEESLGDYSGAIVALNPRDGEILALVSKPGYDPNLFINGIDAADYQALQESKRQPLFNRAVRGRYPPGSTLKPFIALAGLEYGVVIPGHTVYCPGYYTLPGYNHRYRDWQRRGHGATNLEKAIVESCDVYFYELALTLGIERMHELLSRFGFGRLTGIDLTGELAGLIPSREWKRAVRKQPWFPGETLITGIGQGFTLVTPLQLASATATLAMRGERLRPRIVHAVQDADGKLNIQAPERLDSVPVINSANWERVITAMTKVVHSPQGTAQRIGVGATYTIAGKTGTAQVFGLKQKEKYNREKIDAKLRDHALFIAFAPVENPRIALAVVVENGESGAKVAAPIARRVLDCYLLENQGM
jgi:penicillin-binding protein 2